MVWGRASRSDIHLTFPWNHIVHILEHQLEFPRRIEKPLRYRLISTEGYDVGNHGTFFTLRYGRQWNYTIVPGTI